MSLSPLFSNLTSDLHVSNDLGLPSYIVQLHPIQEKIIAYRVLRTKFFSTGIHQNNHLFSDFYFHFDNMFYHAYLTSF